MDTAGREIEAKFLLAHPADVRARLLAGGGRMVSPRILELNLRFDDERRSLSAAGRVLRLRRDRSAHLAYKAPGPSPEERVEIEVEVGRPEDGRRFLEALGFHMIAAYEKYREVFSFDGASVMLDELPFGHFVEIEADSLGAVQATAGRLGLVWERRLRGSYLDFFEAVRTRLGRPIDEATFRAFEGVPALSFEDLESLARRQEAPA